MKWLLGSLAALILAVIVWGTWFVADYKENYIAINSAVAAEPVVEEQLSPEFKAKLEDRFTGDKGAPIALYVFSSYSCYHCAIFNNEVMPELQSYIDEGKLVVHFKDVFMDKRAAAASMLSRCVPKEKYKDFANTLYSSQERWGLAIDYKDILTGYAVLDGMTEADAKECLADKKLLQGLVSKRDSYVNKYNIRGTPTVLISYDGKIEPVNHTEKGMFIKNRINSVLAAKTIEEKPEEKQEKK